MSGDAKHDYHLVNPSAWPIVGSMGAFLMLTGAVFWMNKDYTGFFHLPVNGQPYIFLIGLALVLYTMAGWWRDVINESVVLGNHTPVVKLHLRYGMLLFIASEVMFFVAWFWAYFNAAIFHADVGVPVWPPAGIVTEPSSGVRSAFDEMDALPSAMRLASRRGFEPLSPP